MRVKVGREKPRPGDDELAARFGAVIRAVRTRQAHEFPAPAAVDAKSVERLPMADIEDPL
ncbi:MAG: hypothetical protein KJZ83_03850 [Burkholderiaceae bacterium]|nr:hypothetical protein [Burkholderiaceae bacterium]